MPSIAASRHEGLQKLFVWYIILYGQRNELTKSIENLSIPISSAKLVAATALAGDVS